MPARLRREKVNYFVLNDRGVDIENNQILATGLEIALLYGTSTDRVDANSARGRRMKSGSAPRPSKVTAVTGYLAMRRMRSISPRCRR